MAIETTLVMVKPEAFDKRNEILARFDGIGRRVRKVVVPYVSAEEITEHYREPIQRYGEWLREATKLHFVGQPIVLALYEGENMIKKARDLLGPTDPSIALKGTIRGDYSRDKLGDAMDEGRVVNNVAHASANEEEFRYELSVWRRHFPGFQNYAASACAKEDKETFKL